MMSLRLLCLVVAVVVFVIAAAWTPPAPARFSLTAVGLAFFALAFLAPG
jgi:hypothetical protein